MSRNRKHQTAGARFGPALKALGLCIVLGGSGLGFVWQKEQINTLGDRLQKCEKRFEEVRGENERLARILHTLQTPAQIEARIRQIGLEMVEPDPNQIVRLVETPPDLAPSVQAERLYAGQRFRWWARQ
jgi:hypothetical protein